LVKQSSNSALDSRSRQLGEGEHFDGRVPSTNLIVSAARSVPITLTIDIAEPMGSESLVYLKAGTGNLIARIHREHLFHLGEQVTVRLDMEKVSLFDVETEQVIRWGLRRPSALSY
jgi:ABC-type sugar transport system ATPase subunit